MHWHFKYPVRLISLFFYLTMQNILMVDLKWLQKHICFSISACTWCSTSSVLQCKYYMTYHTCVSQQISSPPEACSLDEADKGCVWIKAPAHSWHICGSVCLQTAPPLISSQPENDLDSPGCWMCLHTQHTDDWLSVSEHRSQRRREGCSNCN